MQNAQIGVYGYAEDYHRNRPYSRSTYRYKGMMVAVGYKGPKPKPDRRIPRELSAFGRTRGPWQGGGSWTSQSFILQVKQQIKLQWVEVEHAQHYMGSNGMLIDRASGSTGNTWSISGQTATCTGKTNRRRHGGYRRSRFACKVELPIGNYQITFDSTNGNSAYRHDRYMQNAQIGVYGYAEGLSRNRPYSYSRYRYRGMMVRVGYKR